MAKERILVVEDEGIVAKDIQTSLEGMGYTVVGSACTGADAIRTLSTQPCDLVLMDIMLKGDADGLKAAEQVRALYDIPVVYLTAYADERTLERAKTTEPFGYVLKPFEESALHTAIEMAFYRHRMERRLKEREQWFATTLRCIGDGVIAIDTAGRVTFLNPVAETLTGWRADDALKRDLREVFRILDERTHKPPEDPLYTQLLSADRGTWVCHATLVARDGSEIPIDSTASLLRDDRGANLGCVFVFRDVRDRERLEAEMLKASKLESVGILAGGIAHDFNNFLTGILGNLSLARVSSGASAQTSSYLIQAEKACWRARELTQQLLTFAKGGTPSKDVVRIADAVREAADFVLHGSTVTCQYSIPTDLWPVEADVGQIGQVVNNIVMNSLEAMPEGGTIRIAAENVTVSPRDTLPVPAGSYIRLTVDDQGTGIPPEHRERIFDPYFTTKKKGSGLGLTTAYSIIRKHAGTIEADSELGRGTTFRIYLPAVPDKMPSESRAERPPARGHGRVLVMDDEAVIRECAQAMLTHLGYDVALAADGGEAVDTYRQALAAHTPFHAVVMDLTVKGGMGGKEAARRILALDPGAHILASSGYSNEPIMAAYAEYGFCGAVPKPYNMNSLGDALQRVVGAAP